MKEKFIIAISAFLALLLIVLISISSYNKDKRQSNYDEIELRTSDYRTEKNALERKLKELSDEYTEIKEGVGSLLLVFLDTDDYLFDTVIPLLNENSIPATLTFSLDNLEKLDEDFAENMLKPLIEKNWETALYWDGTEEFEVWLDDISRSLEALEIDSPQILCIESDDSDLIEDIDLASYGFKELLVKNYSIYDLSYDILSTNTINGLGWFVDNVPDSLAQLCTGGQIAYFVGTEHKFYYYRDDQFASMVKNLVELINSGEIKCTTFSGAKEGVKENKAKLESEGTLLSEQISDIKEKIEDVVRTIDDLIKGK